MTTQAATSPITPQVTIQTVPKGDTSTRVIADDSVTPVSSNGVALSQPRDKHDIILIENNPVNPQPNEHGDIVDLGRINSRLLDPTDSFNEEFTKRIGDHAKELAERSIAFLKRNPNVIVSSTVDMRDFGLNSQTNCYSMDVGIPPQKLKNVLPQDKYDIYNKYNPATQKFETIIYNKENWSVVSSPSEWNEIANYCVASAS